ncbi:MAG: tetratricopeptide repeat protein [Verrucomicrobiia bacterium]
MEKKEAMMSPANNCVTKDEAEAMKWYRKAAEQGYANAQSSLGFMYDLGRGVKQDDKEAVKWWKGVGPIKEESSETDGPE